MEVLTRFAWAFGLAGLLNFIVFGSLYFVLSEFTPYTTGFGVASAVLLMAYVYLDRQRVGDTVSSRSFIYGGGSTMAVLVAAAIGGTSYVLAREHDHRWDLTGNQTFTLSASTLQTIDGLTEPVTIYAFFTNGSREQARFRDTIQGYTLRSDKIVVEFIDPLRSPMLAQQFAITSEYGTVVLASGDSRQRLESEFGEEDVSNALQKLFSGTEHILCWATGHGEIDPDDDYSEAGYGFVVLKLEDRNFTVKKMQVATEGISRECDALLIMRPVKDWMPYEREALAAYIAEGGAALIALDLDANAPGFKEDLQRFGVLMGDDVVWEDDPMLQVPEMDGSFVILRESSFARHPITEPLTALSALGQSHSVQVLKGAQGLKVGALAKTSESSWAETDMASRLIDYDPDADLKGPIPVMVAVEVMDPGVLGVAKPEAGHLVAEAAAVADSVSPMEQQQAEMVRAALADAGIEVEIDPRRADSYDAAADELMQKGEDKAAELVRMIAAQVRQARSSLEIRMSAEDLESAASRAVPEDFAPKPGGRLVVFGDASFASNGMIAYGNNQDLFSNSLGWLIDEPDQISERPDSNPESSLDISLLEMGVIWLISLFLVPGASVGAAVLVMLRRRFL